jgi:hypothetical protein
MKSVRTSLHALLASALTKTASYAPDAIDLKLDRYRELVVTLEVTAADAAGTYDFYLITGNGVGEWDVIHFAQIAGTTVKTFVARVLAGLLPQNITTAAPGVAAVDSATLSVGASGTNAPKSLAVGSVRHGPWGNTLRFELVAAGTPTTGVSFSIQIQATD